MTEQATLSNTEGNSYYSFLTSLFSNQDFYLVLTCYGLIFLSVMWLLILIAWSVCKDSIAKVLMDSDSDTTEGLSLALGNPVPYY